MRKYVWERFKQFHKDETGARTHKAGKLSRFIAYLLRKQFIEKNPNALCPSMDQKEKKQLTECLISRMEGK